MWLLVFYQQLFLGLDVTFTFVQIVWTWHFLRKQYVTLFSLGELKLAIFLTHYVNQMFFDKTKWVLEAQRDITGSFSTFFALPELATSSFSTWATTMKITDETTLMSAMTHVGRILRNHSLSWKHYQVMWRLQLLMEEHVSGNLTGVF